MSTMESMPVGRFHLKEVDGKQYFVYYLDSSREQSIGSGNTDNNDLSVPPLFLCPEVRIKQLVNLYSVEEWDNLDFLVINSSPYFKSVTREIESSHYNYERKRLDLDNHHYVLPLFWCINKDDSRDHRCGMCRQQSAVRTENYICVKCDKTSSYLKCGMCWQQLAIGTDYYLCVKCDDIYHKECVESPPEINHPCHPNHPLKLLKFAGEFVCFHCQTKKEFGSRYHCTVCNVSVDIICAVKSIPFVIEKPKRHDHPLTFFTRKDHLCCNICGWIKQTHSTYACVKCNFVAHQDCAEFPSVIRISRHHHRISFTSSLPSGKWSCGVCRKDVDVDYGAYTCNKCDGYAVHSRCALRKDIWDGEELEGKEDDFEEIIDPLERRNDGSFHHFLHDHDLERKFCGEIYDESKVCDACALPIYKGVFYSCMECDFIIHDKCANAPRKIRHPLHPHPLTLKIDSEYTKMGSFKCKACKGLCSGFIYECNEKSDCFRLDVRCGSISEPFDYKGRDDDHPLYLALNPEEKHLCQICQKSGGILMNCIETTFIICLRCVNIPYTVRYKYDTHFLTLVSEKKSNKLGWCELCERVLISSEKEDEKEDEIDDLDFGYYDRRMYECKECCTTLHVNCLLGEQPFLKPGHTIHKSVQVVANNSLSRPFCNECGNRCVDKLFFINGEFTYCSLFHSLFTT